MSHLSPGKFTVVSRFLPVVVAVVALLLAASAHASAPGIKGSSFALNAGAAYNSQPDGELIYSWGYGCTGGNISSSSGATYAPAQFATLGFCPAAQFPGPTLIVTEGASATFTVTLTNSLPNAAGNTSVVFPGLTVTSCTGAKGLLTCEAIPGGTATYTVSIPVGSAGTHPYYSGTQQDLQIEMGLFGAVVVLPSSTYSNCTATNASGTYVLGGVTSRQDYRLAANAYDHNLTCYDREYLFQWSEMDPRIHRQAEAQAIAKAGCTTGATGCSLDVATLPYHPNYFLINGRSMPDDMDPDYAPNYPNQPYNGNPHMHPGELILLRTIGQGHWQHPFHEHGNHVRILARDGHMLLAQVNGPASGANSSISTSPLLAGRMEFDTDTTPGQSFDGIFYWSGKGLGWDILAHTAANGAANPTCVPDVNGFYTVASGALPPTYNLSTGAFASGAQNYYEWCQDHNVPLEANPVGPVGGGGPMTLFDPLIVTNGIWFNGTPYLGPDGVLRSRGPTPLPPGSALQNPPAESGIAFMWHSHNEREITTNDVFPGGMLMMMLVDPYVWNIDETL